MRLEQCIMNQLKIVSEAEGYLLLRESPTSRWFIVLGAGGFGAFLFWRVLGQCLPRPLVIWIPCLPLTSYVKVVFLTFGATGLAAGIGALFRGRFIEFDRAKDRIIHQSQLLRKPRNTSIQAIQRIDLLVKTSSLPEEFEVNLVSRHGEIIHIDITSNRKATIALLERLAGLLECDVYRNGVPTPHPYV